MSVKLDRGSEVPKCNKCLVSLMGRHYLMQKSQQFCVECYESLFCNTCHTCGDVIATGCRDISYKDFHFHDGCFSCNGCDKSLTGERFIYKDDKFICAECFEEKFSPKCSTCQKAFKPGVKRMEYKGVSYHENCFCCSSCQGTIGKKSFVEKDGGFFCEECFETRLASKCAKCKKAIKTNGVSFRDDTYHAFCLCCAGCSKELAGEKLVTHDDRTYCVTCYTMKFAKKCLKCKEVIAGESGTKMIAFEDYNWHVNCFKCAKCELSLEGEGFIMHEGDTYCQDCADEFD